MPGTLADVYHFQFVSIALVTSDQKIAITFRPLLSKNVKLKVSSILQIIC